MIGLAALIGAVVMAGACADALRLEPPGGGGSTVTGPGGGGGGGAAPVACRSNTDCPEPTSVCDVRNQTCVECLLISDCVFRPGTVCSEGKCVCAGGDEWCGPNDCADLQTSSEHCGKCKHACFGECAAGACADPWAPLPTEGAPPARGRHVAVWTGDKMIVWGGTTTPDASSNLSNGGVFDMASYQWSPMSEVGAPAARQGATAVWTGEKMVVWGGRDGATFFNDGGVYDPATNSWSAITPNGAPGARVHHTAVWTGTLMIVWGGVNDTNQLNSGGRYDPATDTWSPTAPLPAPAAPRQNHTAVWDDANARMLIYGGIGDGTTTNDIYLPGDGVPGGRSYNPASDAWDVLSQVGEPSARAYHTAVWDGSRMLVFGGYNGANDLSNGFKYDNSWAALNGSGPVERRQHTAVWVADAARMVVWGGRNNPSGLLATGGVLDPAANSWVGSVPAMIEARVDHSAVSTGKEMIVWGGFNSGNAPLATGGIYTP